MYVRSKMPKGYIEYQDRIGSQHELTTPGNRKSDVVISAIEKCEKLEKQLKIAVKYLKKICDDYNCSTCMSCIGSAFAKTALYEIKELDK